MIYMKKGIQMCQRCMVQKAIFNNKYIFRQKKIDIVATLDLKKKKILTFFGIILEDLTYSFPISQPPVVRVVVAPGI